MRPNAALDRAGERPTASRILAPRDASRALRPTALGTRALLFLGLLWATYFAIPYTNLFFFGVTFLTVWIGLAGVWTTRSLRGVRVLARAACCPAGTPVRLQLEVAPGGRARSNVLVALDLDDGTVRSTPTPLPDAGAVAAELPPRRRGVHRVRRAALESSAPFGLFRVRVPLHGLAELVVYPAPAPTPAPTQPEPGAEPARRSVAARRARHGEPPPQDQVAGLREYRAGDDARRVHWRGSARRGALVVHDLDADPRRAQQVILDRRCAPAVLEARLSAIVTTALRARAEQAGLTLSTQGLVRTFACDRSDFDALLRLLASLDPLPPDAAAPARMASSGGNAP